MGAKDKYNERRKIANLTEEQAEARRQVKRDKYKDKEYADRCKLRAKLRRDKLKAENPELLAERERIQRAKSKENMKILGANYRARQRKAFVESVNFQKVFDRDKGICHICKKKTSTEYIDNKQPSNYATLDHVIPLNKGGLHCYANVKIACKTCNSTKRDFIPTEGIQIDLFAQPNAFVEQQFFTSSEMTEQEKNKVWQKRYHEKNREEINKRTRERRAANKAKGITEKRPTKEKGIEYSKAYRERNREEINARRARNRAAKREAQLKDLETK